MLTPAYIREIVERALAEDCPWGDVTTDALLADDVMVTAALVARGPGVLAGAALVEATFLAVDSRTSIKFEKGDADRFIAGDLLARVEGSAKSTLRAERVALNFLQRMCGIATLTASYVDAVADTHAKIIDTRKTTPGLRAVEKHAVRCGGGGNHRHSLSDAILVKDNHISLLGKNSSNLTAALWLLRERTAHTTHIEVEVDKVDQIEAVLDGGIDSIMFDNFSIDELKAGVELVRGRVPVVASGGVTLDTVREIAATGVDYISVGALTHSAPVIDLGLDIECVR